MKLIGSWDNYLVTFRRRAGLTQDDVAILLGLGRGTIATYEGSKQIPPLNALLALEMVLGEPIQRIFAGLANEVRDEISGRARALAAGSTEKPSEGNADRVRTIDRLAHLHEEPSPW